MKKLALALLLLQPAAIFAATDKPNPTDYTITVHVVFSHYSLVLTTPNGGYQQLDAVIDGQQVTLLGGIARGVLLPNDYKAKLITTPGGFIPKKQNGFDIFRVYELCCPMVPRANSTLSDSARRTAREHLPRIPDIRDTI